MPAEKKKDKKGKEEEVPVIVKSIYMFANGDKYDGEFLRLEDGSIERQGSGSYYTSDGQVYHGEWKADIMTGFGRLEMTDGAIYEGDFVNNQFHGQGNYIWPNGSCYEGPWNENKMEGDGLFTDIEGQVWHGTFRNKAAPGLRFKLNPPKEVQTPAATPRNQTSRTPQTTDLLANKRILTES